MREDLETTPAAGVNRRRFLLGAVGMGIGSALSCRAETISQSVSSARRGKLPSCRITTLTSGPKHHFFGYYGIPPWNKSGKRLICLESEFQDHLPSADEPASVGLVDPRTGAFTKVGETRAWNLQQGAMMCWNPLNPETEVILNDRRDGEVVAAILNVQTGSKRYLPRANNAVSHNGRYALCLTYGRLTRLRPVVGYVGVKDPNPNIAHPANDGVFLMDLATGKYRLVVSIQEIYERLVPKHPELKERHMWFNHTVFNKDDTRFFFLARSWTDDRQLESAMFTVNIDGSDLREVIPYGSGVSHFEWRNAREILATFRFGEGKEKKHVLFTDGLKDYRVIGTPLITSDGHCSFAPDEKWIATDQGNSAKREKLLVIYNVQTRVGTVLGSFPLRDYYTGDVRCDLHPRWNRTGDAICFDALDARDWTRQLHVASLDFS
jgi:hypothetical protein